MCEVTWSKIGDNKGGRAEGDPDDVRTFFKNLCSSFNVRECTLVVVVEQRQYTKLYAY